MKFFTTISSFLLLLALTITVQAATDAEKACGFSKKVGTPCTVKLDSGHTIVGTCQKKSGLKILRHRTCVPSGTTSTDGAAAPSSGTSSDAASSTDAASTGAGSSAASSST